MDGSVPGERAIPEPALHACLSELAGQVRGPLAQYGAVFSGDLVRAAGCPVGAVEARAVGTGGSWLVTADGFDSLRVLIDPTA